MDTYVRDTIACHYLRLILKYISKNIPFNGFQIEKYILETILSNKIITLNVIEKIISYVNFWNKNHQLRTNEDADYTTEFFKYTNEKTIEEFSKYITDVGLIYTIVSKNPNITIQYIKKFSDYFDIETNVNIILNHAISNDDILSTPELNWNKYNLFRMRHLSIKNLRDYPCFTKSVFKNINDSIESGLSILNLSLHFQNVVTILYMLTYNEHEYTEFKYRIEPYIDWKYIVKNAPLELIEKHMELLQNKELNYYFIFNKNLNEDFIRKYLNFFTRFSFYEKQLFLNNIAETINLEVIFETEVIDFEKKITNTNYRLPDKYCYLLTRYKFKSIHFIIDKIKNVFDKISDPHYNRCYFSRNDNVTLEMIAETLDYFEWDFKTLSGRDIITDEFILKYPDNQWCITDIASNVSISVPFIVSNLDVFMEKYNTESMRIEDILNELFMRKTLTRDDIHLIKTTYNICNDMYIVLSNENTHIIDTHIKQLNQNTTFNDKIGAGITIDIVEKYDHICWSFTNIFDAVNNTCINTLYRKHLAAFRIQTQWRQCFYNPRYSVCKNRVLREYNELIEEYTLLTNK